MYFFNADIRHADITQKAQLGDFAKLGFLRLRRRPKKNFLKNFNCVVKL
nr:hypothetical protein [uncultured Campylobacter sp.]